MPTVSLNEWGVVVRGCTSSTPSILESLSRGSVDCGRGPDMGVCVVVYVWPRWGSPVPGPNGRGDSVSLDIRCGLSSSSGEGIKRFLLLEDSEPRSMWDICGVVEATGAKGVGPGGVSPSIRTSPSDVSVVVKDVLAFLGGG
jgi:hypothetical protein